MNSPPQSINWHSAAYSAIKIEFSYPNEHLHFFTEHPLNEKQRRIDMLIIKNDPQKPISNLLGSIFRKYNLIEYKSPRESLGINAYYKSLSYAYSFKAMPYGSKYVSIDDVTLTLISSRYPRKLFNHLRERKIAVENSSLGVYHINRDEIPIQVIVTSRLDPAKHIWLRCLTNNLSDPREIQMLSDAYAPHLDEPEFSSLMNVIIQANQWNRKGADIMCEALYELFAPQLKKQWDNGLSQGERQGMSEGIKLGETRAKQRLNMLITALLNDQRSDDLLRSSSDPAFQEQLLREYHLL